jgi:hypothetical protein
VKYLFLHTRSELNGQHLKDGTTEHNCSTMHRGLLNKGGCMEGADREMKHLVVDKHMTGLQESIRKLEELYDYLVDGAPGIQKTEMGRDNTIKQTPAFQIIWDTLPGRIMEAQKRIEDLYNKFKGMLQ